MDKYCLVSVCISIEAQIEAKPDIFEMEDTNAFRISASRTTEDIGLEFPTVD